MCLAKTWQVRKPGPLSSVKEAVRLASAGDTILVYPGLYQEKGLTIDKLLYLKGMVGGGVNGAGANGEHGPVLDGEGKFEIVVIKSSGVVFEGFTIRHSGYSSWIDIAGIRLVEVKRVTVRNNFLDDTFFGLYCQNSDSCLLTGNRMESRASSAGQSGNGIHCWRCSHMKLVNNVVTRHRDGIYFEFVTQSLIQGNHSYFNLRYGLHFMFSHDDIYERNTFEHNEAGVSVMFSHGVDMRGNTFADNLGGGAFGILLKEITDSRVESSHFMHNTVGIFMEGTTRVEVEHNEFSGNGWAMKIQASCSEDTIARNNFKGNTFDIATNGTLVLNIFDHNYWDKYEGYDLNRDGMGDVPYHPVSLYAMVAEKNSAVMMLYHSFIVSLLDRSEKVIPSITPANLVDHQPYMKPLAL
jgi:nitrous oxidase accessory protein